VIYYTLNTGHSIRQTKPPMRTTINGTTYDTEQAEAICNEPSPDGDDQLYRTQCGKFFLVAQNSFLDGVKLKPWQRPDEIAPELSFGEYLERVTLTHEVIPMTDREALTWCVKTQMPECFRGYVLESI
jgi:hypothetical protein